MCQIIYSIECVIYVLEEISLTVPIQLCIHSYVLLRISAGKIYAMYDTIKICIVKNINYDYNYLAMVSSLEFHYLAKSTII